MQSEIRGEFVGHIEPDTRFAAGEPHQRLPGYARFSFQGLERQRAVVNRVAQSLGHRHRLSLLFAHVLFRTLFACRCQLDWRLRRFGLSGGGMYPQKRPQPLHVTRQNPARPCPSGEYRQFDWLWWSSTHGNGLGSGGSLEVGTGAGAVLAVHRAASWSVSVGGMVMGARFVLVNPVRHQR